MKLFSLLLIVGCFIHFWYGYQEKEGVHFEISINFCNETYRDFFGSTFSTKIIKLIDENGKKYLMNSDKSPASTFYIDDLPIGQYKISFKNFEGKKMILPIKISEDNQTYDLCIDENIDWRQPTLFNAIEDGEILEVIFEGSGGVYYYEKILIERQGENYFIKDIKIKRDYSVKEDETKSHYENLSFKEVERKEPKSVPISEENQLWLQSLETVMFFIETRAACMTNEEHYYFVKNGELLAEFKNGFCYRISPWGKMMKRFFNR